MLVDNMLPAARPGEARLTRSLADLEKRWFQRSLWSSAVMPSQMVGKGAPEEDLKFLQGLANMHDTSLKLDELR